MFQDGEMQGSSGSTGSFVLLVCISLISLSGFVCRFCLDLWLRWRTQRRSHEWEC